MQFVDLFAGVGGMSAGLEAAGMHCVAHVEINPWNQGILRKWWPDVPIHGDVRSVGAANLPAHDLLAGGPPCQPVSVAGKRRGRSDDRWLWGEAIRIVPNVGPAGAVLRILLASS